VIIQFTLDPALGAWPTDPNVAFQAPGQDLCDYIVPSVQVSSDQSNLTVCLKTMGNGVKYLYAMQFDDTNTHRQQIDPGIANH
jgi:hypothetical protein